MYSVYCIIIALFSVLYCKVPYNIMVQALFIPVNYPCQVSNLYNCSTLIVDIIDLDIIYFLKSRKTSGPSVVHSSNVSRLLISLPNIFSLENTARVSVLWWSVFFMVFGLNDPKWWWYHGPWSCYQTCSVQCEIFGQNWFYEFLEFVQRFLFRHAVSIHFIHFTWFYLHTLYN